jgi:hypothetical protein
MTPIEAFRILEIAPVAYKPRDMVTDAEAVELDIKTRAKRNWRRLCRKWHPDHDDVVPMFNKITSISNTLSM